MHIKAMSLALCFSLVFLFSMDSYSHTRHHYAREAVENETLTRCPLPATIAPPGEKVIIVDPNVHAFGAYSPDGVLQHWGIATAGSNWCRDLHRPCRTRSGTFRIFSLGSFGCVSSKFPLYRGGAPMPYCMYFHGGQALHGSYDVVRGNISHGCVRLHVDDAKWLRFEFVEGPTPANDFRGTKVIIRPY